MCKVVNPLDGSHTIELLGRFSSTGTLTLFLTNESTNVETPTPFNVQDLSNGVKSFTFPFSFAERDKYSIKILQGTRVFYRGKLFATVQETQNFKITAGFIKV